MDRSPFPKHQDLSNVAAEVGIEVPISQIDFCNIGDDYAIHNRINGTLLIVNLTAFAIFEAAAQGASSIEIASMIAADTDAQFQPVLNDVEAQIVLWQKSGLLEKTTPDEDNHIAPACHLRSGFRSGKHNFTFSSNDPSVFALFSDLLAPLASAEGLHELSLVTEGDGFSTWYNGNLIFGPGEFPPARHTAIAKIAALSANEQFGCIFHASAFTLANKTILVSGRSGAGKSTLTASISAQGGTYIADDLIAMDSSMQELHPNPVRINIKANSFEVIRDLYPDLETASDWNVAGMKTRYVQPVRSANFNSRPADYLIFPQYDPNSAGCMSKVEDKDVLSKLTRNGIDLSRNPGALQKLVDFISRTPCYELAYSSTAEALEMINQLSSSK